MNKIVEYAPMIGLASIGLGIAMWAQPQWFTKTGGDLKKTSKNAGLFIFGGSAIFLVIGGVGVAKSK